MTAEMHREVSNPSDVPHSSDVTLKRLRLAELPAASWNLWDAYRQANRELESPYFHSGFAKAVAAVREDAEVIVFMRGDHPIGFLPFQRGAFSLGRPIGGRLSDFHGVIANQDVGAICPAWLETANLVAWDFDHLALTQSSLNSCIVKRDASLLIDISSGYASYCKQQREAGHEVVRKTESRERKLIRERGAISFEYETHDPSVFEALLQWKNEQYARTRTQNPFHYSWTTSLLAEISRQSTPEFGSLVSVLRCQSRPIAICYALRAGPVSHAWFIAYSQEFGTYSPGMIMLCKLLEEGSQRGLKRLHLGTGDQRFKQSLANATVELGIGSVERPSLAVYARRTWRAARDWVQDSPIHAPAKAAGKVLEPLRKWIAFK